MRLPGFVHRKSAPFLSGIVREDKRFPYAVTDFKLDAGAADGGERADGDPFLSAARRNLEADDQGLLAAALDAIPNDNSDWAWWNRIGMAVSNATRRSDEGFELFDRFSKKWPGYDAANTRERWENYKRSPPDRIGAGAIFFMADAAKPGWREEYEKRTGRMGAALDDFYAYMPTHNYIFMPTREPWPARSVDARLRPVSLLGPDRKPTKVRPSAWLDRNRPVEQMTWAPGLPELITDRLVAEGGWIERPGAACLNLYRAPTIVPGDPAKAGPWLNHVRKVYPNDANHIVFWLAHRVQRPQEKINHALVLGGRQGIGKDTLLVPVKRAIGPWNFAEVTPTQMTGRFNGFVKSVILRVSEARDLGEVNRYQFYEHLKAYTAAPPDVLRVDEKNLREHPVLNCTGVILTTNHKTDGIYLPADDRRHYVAWSDCEKEDFTEDYWRGLWGWYDNGGFGHVAALLAELELSLFNPKAPPPKTAAFWDIVDANRAPEDAELADVLDGLGNPDATTLSDISEMAEEQNGYDSSFHKWITDRRNRRTIPHRLEQCGYVPVRNPSTQTGVWVVGGARQVIYAKAGLSLSDQLKAAGERVRTGPRARKPAFETLTPVLSAGRPRW